MSLEEAGSFIIVIETNHNGITEILENEIPCMGHRVGRQEDKRLGGVLLQWLAWGGWGVRREHLRRGGIHRSNRLVYGVGAWKGIRSTG